MSPHLQLFERAPVEVIRQHVRLIGHQLLKAVNRRVVEVVGKPDALTQKVDGPVEGRCVDPAGHAMNDRARVGLRLAAVDGMVRVGRDSVGRMNDNRSAVWGGTTIGLVLGLILGFFIGTYWTTVLYAVGIGAASGVVANILGGLSDIGRRRAATPPTVADHWGSLLLGQAENVLGQSGPADFETTQNAASMCVAVVSNLENAERWRAVWGA